MDFGGVHWIPLESVGVRKVLGIAIASLEWVQDATASHMVAQLAVSTACECFIDSDGTTLASPYLFPT